jgi:hypothetical protein
MTKDEALDLALEALEMVVVDVKTTPTAYEAHRQAITAIKQARALDKMSCAKSLEVEMSNTNTGGPAFPTVMIDKPEGGMTLRDYFAAKAMQGFAAAALEFPTIQDMAACSYGWADTMLKARDA